MNEIDAKNIREIIKQREKKAKFTTGGEIDIGLLNEQSTNELKRMLKEFANSTKGLFEDQLRKQVDRIFEQYGMAHNNMIAFDCTRWSDWERELSTDCEITDIEFDECESELIKPITSHNNDSRYWKDMEILTDILAKLKCPYANKFFKYYDSVNEEWYGCLAITRNYKVVPFVIRNDGYFTDDKYFSQILDEVLNMDSKSFHIYNK